ncbi:MAG: hypothetical protein ACOYXA_03905 [Bacteroidota bacterium]
MKYYYLHVWAGSELDKETEVIDRSVHPFIVDNVGLEIDYWPADDLFATFPIFLVTEKLRAKLIYEKFEDLEFRKILRMSKGLNFQDNYPDAEIPKYWWLIVNGKAGVDDFGLWNRMYLVVSEKALEFLRDNQVTHAESQEITGSLDEYFQSDKKNFWM